jgi:hypothetical protein
MSSKINHADYQTSTEAPDKAGRPPSAAKGHFSSFPVSPHSRLLSELIVWQKHFTFDPVSPR